MNSGNESVWRPMNLNRRNIVHNFSWHSLLPSVASWGPFQFSCTLYFSVILYHAISSSHIPKFSFLSGQWYHNTPKSTHSHKEVSSFWRLNFSISVVTRFYLGKTHCQVIFLRTPPVSIISFASFDPVVSVNLSVKCKHTKGPFLATNSNSKTGWPLMTCFIGNHNQAVLV